MHAKINQISEGPASCQILVTYLTDFGYERRGVPDTLLKVDCEA